MVDALAEEVIILPHLVPLGETHVEVRVVEAGGEVDGLLLVLFFTGDGDVASVLALLLFFHLFII